MNFADPDMLWLLGLSVPLLTVFFWWSRKKRRWLISQFVQSRLLASLTVGVSARRQILKQGCFTVAVALLALTLARPFWSSDWEEARQEGLDVIVAVDTSRSMLATDLTPDRLNRTKLAIRDLLLKTRTDRMGLVPFAGTAFLQCPLTVDEEAFQQNVNILDVDVIPEAGSDVAAAIETAVNAFEEGEGSFRVIVLFSDGEDHGGRALEAAKKAAAEGIRIFTVGVGTTDGELLQFKDARGATQFLRDPDGNVIKSRLNEPLLQQIAGASQGFYLPLSSPDAVNTLYERGLAPLPRGELAAARVRRPIDRFQWPLGLAIVLLVIELFISERRRPSRDQLKAATPTPFWKAAAVLLLAGTTAMASPGSARRAYDKGEFNTALEEYRRLHEKNPDDPRLAFNAGAAAYQAGNFGEAAKLFAEAQRTSDLNLMQQGYYNSGNALFREGEKILDPQSMDAVIDLWQQAVQSYKSALDLKGGDEMAAHNKAFVEEKLMALKKERSKMGENNKDGNQQQRENQKGGEGQQQSGDGNQRQESGKPNSQSDSDQQRPQSGEEDQQQQQAGGGEQQQDQQQGAGEEEQQQPTDPNEQLGAYGQMTAEQARQLLEAQRGEERALLFLPQNRTNRIRDPKKNW